MIRTPIIEKTDKVPLIYSTKFDNYLSNMLSIDKMDRHENTLVSTILSMYKNPCELSYIDITEKEDTISLIPASRIFKLYKKSFKEINKRDFDNYINAEDLLYGVHTYVKNYSGVWNTGRIEMKVGKFIKKLNDKLTDSQIEEFVNKYKALHRSRSNPTLSLVSGEQITYWYDQDRYAHSTEDKRRSGIGTLGKSCMRYGANYFYLYEKNPEVCQMLILQSKDDHKNILGRALVWKLEDGSTYMDRIYTHFDSDIYVFVKHATENGWHSHHDNTSGKTKFRHFHISLKEAQFDYYPYMDTFCYLSVNEMKLSSDFIKCSDLFILRNTNGTYDQS